MRRALAALVTTGALALAAPLAAEAATGTFTYGTPSGLEQLVNPPSNQPIAIDGAFFANNRTDEFAVLFFDAQCRLGPIFAVPPNSTAISMRFGCVRFRKPR